MINEFILSIIFVLAMTVIGAGMVFFVKNIYRRLYVVFMGLASGIMISSSIFSLIIPSLEQSEGLGYFHFLPAMVGVLVGALLMSLLDFLVVKAKNTTLSRSGKLFFAMTFHNVPEGLAVGVAFGSFIAVGDPILLASAIGLAIGIGIQNIPEGFTVSVSMRLSGYSKRKSFLMGVLSGVVEPIFACLGAMLVVGCGGVLPWLLALSAGSMLMVVVSELMTEIKGQVIGCWAFIVGFVLMMVLDNLKLSF